MWAFHPTLRCHWTSQLGTWDSGLFRKWSQETRMRQNWPCQGMLSHYNCHRRFPGSSLWCAGVFMYPGYILGCVGRCLEKMMWKLKMSLGKGCFLGCMSVLTWRCPSQAPLNLELGLRVSRPFFLMSGPQVPWPYSSHKWCHREAMHILLCISSFHLQNLLWSQWQCS